jgi:uncharacterized protein YbjT (DUF2867 family)
VLLAGATGLTGRLLLDRLLRDGRVASIIALGRRPVDAQTPKITSLTGPMEDWPALVGGTSVDIAISALGTTMRMAGSEEAFAAVDHDAVVCLARAALGAGARQFLLVSAVGAHPSSRNFYLSVKGKAEAGVQAAGYDRLDIFRPGLLRGARGGDRRVGERIAIAMSPLTDLITPRVLDHYRSIAAADVADAMMAMLGREEPGVFVHENRAMWDAIGRG